MSGLEDGLEKVFWNDIREEVRKVEPSFASIVDELAPNQSFPLFLARYPYGELIADHQSAFLPSNNGRIVRLSDALIPEDITKHLGYGKDSLPMGLVLEKRIEYFIDLAKEGITIPWLIYDPGSFFPFTTILGKKAKYNYMPNGLLAISSGARSAFMLPNIGCYANHINLQRDCGVNALPPKSHYDHSGVFKEIINSKKSTSNWQSSILYFSEKWLIKLHNDKKWLPLKAYFSALAWSRFEYERNQVYYDISFSLMQKNRNLKPNPYLMDTVKHLFAIALGAAPGYAPAFNNDSLPVDKLQEAFIESYGLTKYIPTIMQPEIYHFDKKRPVYYSLQHPTLHSFSPKSCRTMSTMVEIRDLSRIIKIFTEELLKEKSMCSDTVLYQIAKEVNFNYFHNDIDQLQIIRSSCDIAKMDARFKYTLQNKNKLMAKFAEDAKFFRGCISLSG